MYKLLDAGVVVNTMLLTQVYEFFELGDSAEKRAFMDHIRYGRALDVDPNSELGATNLQILNGIKTDTNADMQTKLGDFLTTCDSEAQVAETETATPEEINLSPTNQRTSYKLTIANSAESPTRVKIMQRIGTEEDLTEWHECGGFVNVHYKQLTYQCQIPQSPTEYRELKAVCDEQIGMTIEVI